MSATNERKYQNLVSVLDGMILENALTLNRKVYRPTSEEERDQARSRAFIHLYLKVAHAVSQPLDREHNITDGTHDGGLDSYFIDKMNRKIYLVQSKFRSTPTNFTDTRLANSDIATLQIDEIVKGETHSSDGYAFSGHILRFQNKLAEIEDIADYEFLIVVLANLDRKSKKIIERLYSDYTIDVYDFERTYDSLLYPLLTSEECVPEKAIFAIDTTTKKLGPRVHAEILTRYGPSEMSILLVPAIEIAKLVLTYKNALLSYNPRSYLEFQKQGTNLSIKESITSNNYDEFALFNNGVTMIADRCEYSERTGKPNVASLSIYDPQIINGGQTAFTLAQVLSETGDESAEAIFHGKEVLLKVIALGNIEAGSREPLAIDISRAANTQTAVTYADRKANTAMHRHIAFRFFELTGLLYEYKTGLFDTAKRADCIDGAVILDRNLFHRLLYAAQGNFNLAAKSKLMQKGKGVSEAHPTDENLLRVAELFELFRSLEATGRRLKSVTDYLRDVSVGWGIIEAAKKAQLEISTKQVADLAAKSWESFLTFSLNAFEELDPDLLKNKERKRKVGSLVSELNNGRWKHETSMNEDLVRFGRFLLERDNLIPTPPPPAAAPASA